MGKIFKVILILEIITLLSRPCYSEVASASQTTEVTDADWLEGIIEVMTEHQDSVIMPEALEEMIEEIYSAAVVPPSVTNQILSYVTDIFSEHSYHDTGHWVKSVPTYTYVPYKGNLPEYEMTDFQKPAIGRQTSMFGYRKKFCRFHHGVDLALNIGDTVKCVLPGVVVKTGLDPDGYGRYVVVSHSGGMDTLYGHLQAALATPGQKMKAGDTIGLGGATGNATGPHLHFETRFNGVAIDPNQLFDFSSNSDLRE